MTDNLEVLDSETLNKVRAYVQAKAQQLAPAHIAPYIQSDIEQSKNGTWGVKLKVDLRYGAKDARAQEYGSGEHNVRNFTSRNQTSPSSRIKITGNPFLAFEWEKAPAALSKRKAKDGKYIFKSVMHPGIKAANNGRGYMRLAMQESKEYVMGIVKEAGAESIKFKVRAIFSRPGGKNK